MKIFLPFLLSTVFLLYSCLDSTVSIKLNKDLSGSLEAVYTISGESEYVSSDLVNMRYEYLPVDGTSLKGIADGTTEITLDSFKQTRKGNNLLDTLAVHFTRLQDIEKLSGYTGKVKILSLTEKIPGILKITLKNPLDKNISSKTLQLLTALYSNRKINISIKVSGFITNTDRGALAEDPSVAVYDLPLMELLRSSEPIVWTITYRK